MFINMNTIDEMSLITVGNENDEEGFSWLGWLLRSTFIVILVKLFCYFMVPVDKIAIKVSDFDFILMKNTLRIIDNVNDSIIEEIKDCSDCNELLYNTVDDKRREEVVLKIINDIYAARISNSITNIENSDVLFSVFEDIDDISNKFKKLAVIINEKTKIEYGNLMKILNETKSVKSGDWKIVAFGKKFFIFHKDIVVLKFEDDISGDLLTLLSSKISEICFENCGKIVKFFDGFNKDKFIKDDLCIRYGSYTSEDSYDLFKRIDVKLFDSLFIKVQTFVELVNDDLSIINNDVRSEFSKVKSVFAEFKNDATNSGDKLKIVFKKFRDFVVCAISADAKDIDEFVKDANDKKFSYHISKEDHEVKFNNHNYNIQFVANDMVDLNNKIQTEATLLLNNIDSIIDSVRQTCKSFDGKAHMTIDQVVTRIIDSVDVKIRDFVFKIFIMKCFGIYALNINNTIEPIGNIIVHLTGKISALDIKYTYRSTQGSYNRFS